MCCYRTNATSRVLADQKNVATLLDHFGKTFAPEGDAADLINETDVENDSRETFTATEVDFTKCLICNKVYVRTLATSVLPKRYTLASCRAGNFMHNKHRKRCKGNWLAKW